MNLDPKRILSFSLMIFSIALSVSACKDTTLPSSKHPPSPDTDHNATSRNSLTEDLRTALFAEDEMRVMEITEEMIEQLGPKAGIPEVAPRYYLPIERDTPDLDEAWQLWDEIEARTRQDLVWLNVPDGDPRKMSNGLRQICRPMIAFAALSEVRLADQDEYIQLVREGAEYVSLLQLENGLFPFPDLRGRHSLFGPMIERLLRQFPDSLVDGWIVDDGGYGDLKFDNGICGVAMLEAYRLTHEREYLDSAHRASDWAVSQPLSTNWNYNAFSVWLLARFSKVSGEDQYLDAAYEHFRLGILPGQLPDGQWFDPHNTRLVYHSIIVRGILELDQALPPDDPRRREVRESLTSALDFAADEITKYGASSVSTTTEILSRALREIGFSPEWETALNININASLKIMGDPQAPYVGLYLADYMFYRIGNR